MAQVAQKKANGNASKLYVAFELSQKNWKLVVSDGTRTSEVGVPARDLSRVLEVIKAARRRLGTTGKVVSCYEPGRDGFWLHRALLDEGIENVVLDAASIEVDRRARRAKTDRLDTPRSRGWVRPARGVDPTLGRGAARTLAPRTESRRHPR